MNNSLDNIQPKKYGHYENHCSKLDKQTKQPTQLSDSLLVLPQWSYENSRKANRDTIVKHEHVQTQMQQNYPSRTGIHSQGNNESSKNIARLHRDGPQSDAGDDTMSS